MCRTVTAIFLPQGWVVFGVGQCEFGIVCALCAHWDAIAALLADGVEVIVDDHLCAIVALEHFGHGGCTSGVTGVEFNVFLECIVAVRLVGVIDA